MLLRMALFFLNYPVRISQKSCRATLELAAQFEGVAKIEKAHEERYLKLLENLKNGEVFKKDGKVLWFCRNCGHVELAVEAPAVCPVCHHPQSYFKIKAENY